LLDRDLQNALSRQTAIDAIAEEMARHIDHPNPARSFYFWNRTRREMALTPFRMLSGLKVETPYLRRPLWDFLDGLPYAFVADRDFHSAVIRAAYPGYVHLPFEDKSAVGGPRRVEQLVFAMDFFRHTVLRRTRRLHRPRIAKRIIGMLKDGDPWWNPTMVLYLAMLLVRRLR
jgi:hypothetical protein